MPPHDYTLTSLDVRALFKKNLNLRIERSTIYYYINRHDFPRPHPFGRPRLWSKKRVAQWFAQRKKQLR